MTNSHFRTKMRLIDMLYKLGILPNESRWKLVAANWPDEGDIVS